MDPFIVAPALSPERKEQQHRRSRSEAVSTFKTLVSSSRSRSPAKSPAKNFSPQRGELGQNRSPAPFSELQPSQRSYRPFETPVMLPADHPHAPFQVLGEVQNRGMASPKRFDKAAVKHKRSMTEIISRLSPKKSHRQLVDEPKDKENTTPPGSSDGITHTPIWAQLATQRDDLSPSKKAAIHPLTKPIESRVSQIPASPSKVKTAVAMYNNKEGSQQASPNKTGLTGPELDAAFDAVLVARDIPENMRANMRSLDAHVKREFIKNSTTRVSALDDADATKSGFWSRSRAKSSTRGRDIEVAPQEDVAQPSSPSKRGRSRSRGRVFTLGKGDKSPFKRPRSSSRPRSIMSLKNFSSSSVNSLGLDGSKESKEQQVVVPDGFIRYLNDQRDPQKVEIGKVHKLRLLARNESIAWTDTFIIQGGMTALIGLLGRIIQVEWREEHEDMLLHEVLLCLKGLCTTQRAQEELVAVAPTLFPSLLKMLFDDERKGPSEFNTRGIIIHLLFTHLTTATAATRAARTTEILGYLSDPDSPEDDQPVGFIAQMQQRRPYQVWHKEVSNVTKEVFWIFLHHLNVISLVSASEDMSSDELGGSGSYFKKHFPRERPPVPAAPYVGGVEWEATNYLAQHLDLVNGLIASLPTRSARNQLRADLAASGFEKVMGGTLRLCKEKFYGAVHDVLRTWVSAAADDGWDVHDVRMGPPKEERSPAKSGAQRKPVPPPKLELPKLDLGVGSQIMSADDGGWL